MDVEVTFIPGLAPQQRDVPFPAWVLQQEEGLRKEEWKGHAVLFEDLKGEKEAASNVPRKAKKALGGCI